MRFLNTLSRAVLDQLREAPPVCVLDEIHKLGRWKGFLKGLFDRYAGHVRIVVVRDGEPWFLVEVNVSGRAGLSPHLSRFQGQTGAPHAFQVALDLPFVARDCFSLSAPTIVPARTLLAQLV